MLKPFLFRYGKRYKPISQHYHEIFGSKVYKVSISIAETCPNRKGLNSSSVCIFCDEWGSAAYHNQLDKPVREQIRINKDAIRKRYRAEKFLIYFQSYTNTFGNFKELEKFYNIALEEKDVFGLIIGTRPDCLPKRIMKKFEEISEEKYLSIELGVQTLDEKQLIFLSRGHDKDCSIKAINKIKNFSNINLCIHLIFGLPNESDQQIIDTAKILSDFEVDGVKLHNLHVLKNTPLETMYRKSEFFPINLEDYARKVTLFLENLSPKIAVHRLTAVSSRWEELIAPKWTREKMRPTQFIEDYLKKNNTWQGRYFNYKNNGRFVQQFDISRDV